MSVDRGVWSLQGNITCYLTFRCELKTFLFNISFPDN